MNSKSRLNNMWNRRILILIIFVSVVLYNIVGASRKCDIITGFAADKLEGTWHFIARIGGEKEKVRCGYLFLRRKSEHRFRGIISGIYGDNKLRNVRIHVYYRDGIFAFRYEEKLRLSEEFLMRTRTCNGKSEFSLELSRDKMYWIFGRDTNVTPVFLKRYRILGKQKGLKFLRLNNTNCPEFHN